MDSNNSNTQNSEIENQTEKPQAYQTAYGKVLPSSINNEMEKFYLDYAMSVIVARALPDVRDGLKPVHRRILFAMRDMNITHKSAYKKCARVVGEVLGKYHPHGDSAVYGALVRLAQDFSMRYPLVDGQGNFGSVDGDNAAAMRYTECRLAKISDELLNDLDKNTVDYVDNFDGSQQEPEVLPAKLPNLLLMGSEGIAVGMATKIPTHNLTELIGAIKVLIGKSQTTKPEVDPKQIENVNPQLIAGKLETDITIDELMNFVKGPDFPTGANIFKTDEIKKVYQTGRGKIIIRSTTSIEEDNCRHKIVVSDIPYQVNKSKLIQDIARLIRDKKIIGISDIRDESDRRGLQITIELKKGTRPQAILNNLYKHTALQTSFPVNMVALVDGIPQLCNLKIILTEYVKHRQLVIVRRNQHELKAAKLRAHILEGLKIALDNLDEVIKTIRQSKDTDTAREALISKFGLSKIQAEAILDMQLRRLSALERQKIEDEYKELLKKIEEIIDILLNPQKILNIITKELDELNEIYGDKRKTKIIGEVKEISQEDLIPNNKVIISVTKTGYVKRVAKDTYKTQRRGGKGVTSMSTKTDDEIAFLTTANNHDDVLFFTNKGKVYHSKAFDIPEGSRQSKGQAVINIINIDTTEKIRSIIAIKDLPKANGNLIMATKLGMVKKTTLDKFVKIKSNGIASIKLDPKDQLISVKTTTGNDFVFMVTHLGKAILFKEKDVRPMGRATKGVRGIKIKENDYLVTMETFPEKMPENTGRKKQFRDLMVVTEKGIGKRTPVDLFPIHKRAGVGVKIAKLTERTGNIVAAEIVTNKIEQIMLTTKKAQTIKLPLKNIKQLGRNTQGIILMRFGKNDDGIAAMTCIGTEEEPEDN